MTKVSEINEIRNSLSGLFTKKELKTLKAIDPTRKCPKCQKQCGAIFILNECSCVLKKKMCGNCTDELYDNYGGITSELFKCDDCNTPIFNLQPSNVIDNIL